MDREDLPPKEGITDAEVKRRGENLVVMSLVLQVHATDSCQITSRARNSESLRAWGL